jgi:hypothetical protein
MPLIINLPDGTVVRSTHVCDYEIPGLSTLLEVHIVPELTLASLIGIPVLCKAGCVVIFTDKMCSVMYGGKIYLRGYKDPSTDLWILPITLDKVCQQGKLQTSPGSDYVTNATKSTQSQAGPCMTHALQFPMQSNEITPILPEMTTFTHSVRTCANTVKFVHQSLCNPKISSLMKAMQRGFLKGCPNLNQELVVKHLNLSPATAKRAPTFQRMKLSMAHTIGTDTHSHRLGVKPSFTKPWRYEACGRHTVPMHGMWGRLKTIIDAIYIMSRRREHIKCRDLPSCFRSIVKSQTLVIQHI